MAKPRTNILPGYVWDQRTANYRNTSTGRFVKRKEILGLLEDKVEAGKQVLQNLGMALQEGRITAAEFQVAFAQTLKTQYLQTSALSKGGWDRLTQADYGRVGGNLRREYQHLAGFTRAIVNEELSSAQVLARAAMYGGGARGLYFENGREGQRGSGKTEMRRILGVTDRHCPECLEFASRNWVPLGSNPPPSSHPSCFGNCLCDEIYR